MLKDTRIIDFITVTIAALTIGFITGYILCEQEFQNKSSFSFCEKGTPVYDDCMVNLSVCESVAAIMEEELSDTLYKLDYCIEKIEEFL